MGKWWLCGVATAIVVVSAAVIGGVTATEQPSPPADTAVTAVENSAAYGTLGVWNGRLALFCGGETPTRVYDVWISSLPPEEQEKLSKGIKTVTRREFLALLQEYTD